jgi:hypothetical protein
MSKTRSTKRRRRNELTDEEVELELFERGWKPTPLGRWRHPNLELDWPPADAQHLQDEADAGMQDKVHRQLRGDL